MAESSGEAFRIDSEKVHVCPQPFFAKNAEAMTVVKSVKDFTKRCGRTEWIALNQHHLGDGLFSKDLVEARDALENVICTGENPPKMTHAKFKSRPHNACATVITHHK